MKLMHLQKSILTVVFLMGAVIARAADATPTLPETVAYITDKLNNLPNAVVSGDKSAKREICGMKVDWFNGGILCVVATQRNTAEGKPVEERLMRYQFPLASLSTNVTVIPSATTEGSSPVAYGVVISSALPAQGTVSQGSIYVQDGNSDVRSWKKATLWFKSEDTAKRLADAFKHAIELSGGKKELFGD